MKPISIQGCQRLISPLIIGPHCVSKAHDDKDFDDFVELGGNCFYMHGEGGETQTRKNVASWIKRLGNREDLVLFFQICHGHDEVTSVLEESRFSPKSVSDDIEENLNLLEIDYLDLVVLGGDNENIPAAEIIDVLEDEKAQGRISAYGPFNWSPARIQEAQDYTENKEFVGFSFVNTTELSLATPTSAVWEGYTPFDASMRGLITQKQLPVLAWTSDFNQSFFIPREINRDSVPKDRRLNRWYTDENFAIREKAAALGAKYNLNVRQINVAYLLNQDFPTAVMCYQDHDPSAQEYFAAINSAIRKQELEELRPKNLT
jgi:aryl-alcohol dehydrogenase-like predicted oxidoreductase